MSISNTVTVGGVVTLSSGGLKNVFSLSDNFNTTGSHFITDNASVNTGSWQVLTQGSDANMRYGFFVNTDLTSSCKLAINASGTSSYAAWLQPGDCCILPNLGSVVLYAEATGSNPTIVLQYLLTEA